MEHKGTVALEGGRLMLRRFTQDDAAAMYSNLYSDEEAMRFLPWTVHSAILETSTLLAKYINAYPKLDRYAWAIVLKSIDEPIGFIDASVYGAINAVKIDYGIGKAWWNKGITSEALSMVIQFFFNEVGANRIFATHDPRNPGSGKVMQKCAMTYEGTLRQARYRKGEYSDRVMYSILAAEYFSKHAPDIGPQNEIDKYIASQPANLQALLSSVCKAIRQALPEATEKISWQMPTFWQGRNLIHFAAQKNHLGIYPGAEAMRHFAPRLTEYKTSKGAIQFPYKSFGEEQLRLIAEIAAWTVTGCQSTSKSPINDL